MTPPGGQSGPFSNLDYSQKGYSKIKRTDLGPTSAVSATLLNLEGAWDLGPGLDASLNPLFQRWSGPGSALCLRLHMTPECPMTPACRHRSFSLRTHGDRDPLWTSKSGPKWVIFGVFWGSGIPPRWRVLPKVLGS